MLTCEKCGVSFEQPESTVEVTSLRVLCPECMAERAAAKARTAGVASSPPAARPAAPAPAARAIPAASVRKSVDASPEKAKAAPMPAPRPAPAARPAQTSAPAPKPTAAGRPALAKPLDGKPVPSKPAAGKGPAPAPAKAKAKPKEHVEHDLEGIHRSLEKKGSRELIIAFVVSFVVFAAAGVAFWKVREKKDAEQAAIDAYAASVKDFKDTFGAMDIQSEAGATQLIAFAEEKKALWQEMEDYAGEVVSRVAKAKTFLEGLTQRRDFERRLTEIEQTLAGAAELAPTDLAEQRRRLDELAARAEIGGADFVARVARDREQAEKVYVERLVSAAQAAATTEPMDRAALATLQQSEDELFKMLDSSAKLWMKNKQDAVLTARKEEFQDKYKAAIKLSDEAVQRFFTPAVIEAVPWRDLLSPDQASHWKFSSAKGYEHGITNGVLHLIGPDPSEKSEALMTIGDKEIWRDFEIDMEFTILKGMFTTYYRFPLVYQENIYYFDLKTDEGFLEVGRTYSYTLRILASTFTDEQKSEDSSGPNTDSVPWTNPRKGAFGIGIAKETEVKFTRLRARVLR